MASAMLAPEETQMSRLAELGTAERPGLIVLTAEEPRGLVGAFGI